MSIERINADVVQFFFRIWKPDPNLAGDFRASSSKSLHRDRQRYEDDRILSSLTPVMTFHGYGYMIPFS
jgi:hypothetical protein